MPEEIEAGKDVEGNKAVAKTEVFNGVEPAVENAPSLTSFKTLRDAITFAG